MMPSIESLGYPLAYKVRTNAPRPTDLAEGDLAIRAEVRALEGMQKEATIFNGSSETVWRMVSDEGPYLNGTDLAPFPLAFYTSGMAFSFVAELLKHAAAQGVSVKSLRLEQDNYYTMEGSAIRGDMLGGALPPELRLDIEADADAGTIASLVRAAEATSPAQAYMRSQLKNRFALTQNGTPVEVTQVESSPSAKADPAAHIEQATPLDENGRDDIIIKLETTEAVFGVEGGAGSSLRSEQKRTLHVRGIVTQRDDGLWETHIQLFRPIGSSFRFLCDLSAQEQAPAPEDYLAAGVGFCFLTQAGRYAHIVKQDLKSYRIVQDNIFKLSGGAVSAEPVDTHLFVEQDEPASAAQKLLSMSERTCFLHAAMRGTCPSAIEARLNGETLAL